MPQYKAPLRDIRFLVHNVLDFPTHYRVCGHAEVGADLIDPVLEEAARFCENVLAPTYRDGDETGTHMVNGRVVTPDSYKGAWQALTEAQWGAISCDPTCMESCSAWPTTAGSPRLARRGKRNVTVISS